MRKKWVGLILAMVAVLSMTLISGCTSDKNADPSAEKTSIKVGVTPGPHAEVMEVVQKVAAKEGLTIEIIEFSDYIQPNVALNQGEIDVNSYQHQPFLDAQVKDRGYKIETLAKTILFPMGVYSKNLTAIQQVPENGVIAIPNDPSNGGRALNILEKAGLIKLKENAGLSATAADIVENPKHLVVKELEAAQIPLSLSDVSLAVINTNYAVSAGLVPTKDALFLEDAASPYANILVVRSADKENIAYQKFVKAYHSEEVKQFVNDHFAGSGIATW